MDWMANEFRDRFERQWVNDHDRVQIRRVNTNVNDFVADNMDMSDVDFKYVSMGQKECFGQ